MPKPPAMINGWTKVMLCTNRQPTRGKQLKACNACEGCRQHRAALRRRRLAQRPPKTAYARKARKAWAEHAQACERPLDASYQQRACGRCEGCLDWKDKNTFRRVFFARRRKAEQKRVSDPAFKRASDQRRAARACSRQKYRGE